MPSQFSAKHARRHPLAPRLKKDYSRVLSQIVTTFYAVHFVGVDSPLTFARQWA